LEDEKMGVENGGMTVALVGLDLVLERHDLFAGDGEGAGETVFFSVHLGLVDGEVLRLFQGFPQPFRRTHRDPRRDTDALESDIGFGMGGCHAVTFSKRSAGGNILASAERNRASSPKRPGDQQSASKPLSTSLLSCSRAAAASSPSAVTRMTEPWAAASIISPMMLFPLISSSSFSTQTSQANRLASLTNFAAGRAWSPSSFGIVSSQTGIKGRVNGRRRGDGDWVQNMHLRSSCILFKSFLLNSTAESCPSALSFWSSAATSMSWAMSRPAATGSSM